MVKLTRTRILLLSICLIVSSFLGPVHSLPSTLSSTQNTVESQLATSVIYPTSKTSLLFSPQIFDIPSNAQSSSALSGMASFNRPGPPVTQVGGSSPPTEPATIAGSALPSAFPNPGPNPFSIYGQNNVQPVPSNEFSLVDEPSVANNGNTVFYTGNWYTAVSGDGGKTWKYTNPFFDMFDLKMRFVDSNGNHIWDQGEPVVYDTNNDGVYDAGDTVIAGTPTLGQTLSNDVKLRYVDSANNNAWKPGDSVVYDTNGNVFYDTGEPVIAGPTPSPGVRLQSDFCCDQDVIYSPSKSVFLWYRQGTSDATGLNRFRLGVSSNGLDWTFYDFHPTDLNSAWTAQSFDHPILALSNSFLYTSTNVFGATGSFVRALVMRFPLDSLATSSGLQLRYYSDTTYASFALTEGATNTMYWGSHANTATLRLYGWGDGSTSLFVPVNISHPSYLGTLRGSAKCPSPDGGDICARTSADISMGGWVANGIIGFYWDVKQDGAGTNPCSAAAGTPGVNFPCPYIDVIRIYESTKTYLDNPIIWNPSYAWVYAWISPNSLGDIGVVAFTSGAASTYPNGQKYPTFFIGMLDGYEQTGSVWTMNSQAVSTSGPNTSCINGTSNSCWGDFVRIRPFSGMGDVWIGAGFTLQSGNLASNIVPTYVVFGRVVLNDPRQWVPVGPSSIQGCAGRDFSGAVVTSIDGNLCSGRVAAIAFDPTDSTGKTIYVGAAQGGVWKTVDGGSTWTPMSDNQPSLAVGAIAVDQFGIIYVGTGEGDTTSCDSYYGAGVLRSTDGGNSWVQLGADVFGGLAINKIAVVHSSATVPPILFASVTSGYSDSGTSACQKANSTVNLGLYRSDDGGNTWIDTVLVQPPSGQSLPGYDVISDPTKSSTVYASVGGRVYNSSDLGHTWTALTSGAPPTGLTATRINLATSPAIPGIVYAAVATNQGQLWRLRFTSNPSNYAWSQLALTPPVTGFCDGQCDYDIVVAADPANPNTLYLGGLNISRTNDINDPVPQWTDLGGYSGYVHSDQHTLVFNPISSSSIYLGNDGGIWSSSDGNTINPGVNCSTTTTALCWKNLNNGLLITQFQSLAADPKDDSKYFGGTQDNGSVLSQAGSSQWTQDAGGDGGWTAIDTLTTSTMYHAFPVSPPRAPMTIQRSDNGGSSWFNINSGINPNDPAQFYPALAMDPTTPTTLFLGTYRLYKTTTGGLPNGAVNGWALAGLDLSSTARCIFNGICGKISAISVAKSNGQFVYVGTSVGTFWVSSNGGSSFTEQDSGLPGVFITKIAVDPGNPQRVYITFSGFSGKHVFTTSNASANPVVWTDADGNLPNTPANSVIVQPDGTVYAGTDVGVFVSMNFGGTWSTAGRGLPRVAVFDLVFSASGTLLAATHGRGVWALKEPSLVTVVRGTDNGIYWSSFSYSTGTWSGFQSLSGTTSSAPALCPSGPGRFELIVRGTDNGIYHKSFLNGAWSPSWDSPGGSTIDRPSCAVLNEVLHLVVRGSNNGEIYYNSLPLVQGVSPSWGGWIDLNGNTSNSTALVASTNRLDLVVRGTNDQIYHKAWTGSWAASWDGPSNGSTSDLPAVAVLGSTLHVVVRGLDNGLYYNQFNMTTNTWSSWTQLGGSTSNGPGAAPILVSSLGRLDLIVRGGDNGVYHKSWTRGWAANWDSPGGLTGNVPAVAVSGALLDIVVDGLDGTPYNNSMILYNGSWQGWTSIGGSTNSPPVLSIS